MKQYSVSDKMDFRTSEHYEVRCGSMKMEKTYKTEEAARRAAARDNERESEQGYARTQWEIWMVETAQYILNSEVVRIETTQVRLNVVYWEANYMTKEFMEARDGERSAEASNGKVRRGEHGPAEIEIESEHGQGYSGPAGDDRQ